MEVNGMKKLGQIVLAFFSVMLITFAYQTVAAAETHEFQGIDVSRYQEDIDFEAVSNAGIEVVYIKASEGVGYVDPYFEQNYEGAKAANLKVGFYHFVIARTVEQAIEEANWFVSIIQDKDYEAKPVVDFEDFGNLSTEQINEITRAFAEEVVKLTNQDVMIYSNASNATNVFDESLTKYSLWVAQYGPSEPSNDIIWDTWAGWQYTDTGTIDGVNGNVDLNVFNDGIFLNDSSIEAPTPQESTNKTTTYTIKAGDTLTSIARNYQVTVAHLVELNNINNPNLIFPGQELRITSDGTQNSTPSTYVVKSGDTLYAIAKKYNTTVAKLVSENNIKNPDLIYPGDRIIISK
ncbi:LysM peptidoglycan-binding domain-containing protein [Lysinibacillus antri]|uniref:Lysozyme n=2 Tax=Lysinibacillus antri TaxID=2498145 RepID=A0A432LB24_9BACI|nr:LysM peptidoglycan-binding domain-containing protein [Lysinibacillus antri]